MSTNLYEKYLNLSRENLFTIIENSENYTAEAVKMAHEVALEKGWGKELDMLLEEKRKNTEAEELAYENELLEKSEYYRNLLEFKEQKQSFEIRISDVPKFESALMENEILFFREDKHIGPQIDIYPTQTYYFRNEDAKTVDKLVKELELITTPYVDVSPFFKKEIIIGGFIFFVVLIIIMTFI